MKKIENRDLGRMTLEQYREADKFPITLVLDSLRSLNNVGAMFRTADAFSVERIILCGISATPPNKEIHKTALGAEMSVPWSYHKECSEAIESLKSDGYEILAIEQVQSSVMLGAFTVDSTKKYALVFGNEVAGVQQSVVDMCDGYIEIPQNGTKHSLNVSVAGGIVLWHFFNAFNSVSP